MKLLVTGGTGFVGRQLVKALLTAGHEPVLLSRTASKPKHLFGELVQSYAWDTQSAPPPKEAYDGIDAIINLMGEGIAEKRWTTAQKQKLRDSRILGTSLLVEGAKKHAPSGLVFISSSAIGYYDHSTSGPFTENSPSHDRFLGQLCQDWESAALQLTDLQNSRVVLIRTGIVLGDGGALQKMKGPFSLGLGGRLGSGQQWMNWIHLNDLVQIFLTALENKSYKGVYNAVSPGNVTNDTFTKALGSALSRPTIFPVPAFALKLALGELSQELLEGGNVIPERLQQAGFRFKHTDVLTALEDCLK